MKFQAAIFDMDGTIILTEEIWQQSAIQIIEKKCNISLSSSEKNALSLQLAGSGLEHSARIIQQAQKELCTSNQKEDLLELIMAEYKALTLSLYSKTIPFVSGFKTFHQKLTAKNIPTAIATNAPLDALQATNRILHLDQYFGLHMYSVSQINNVCKPDPAIYLYAAHQLGIDPKQCIAFEDSIPGIIAAKAAGMYCIGIKTPSHPEFIQNADISIDSYDQIDFETLF